MAVEEQQKTCSFKCKRNIPGKEVNRKNELIFELILQASIFPSYACHALLCALLIIAYLNHGATNQHHESSYT
jgi:hypothetical protein